MRLKIGELAKRSGLTVRALHHYDSIGLLSPSARSDAGYRLYNRDDIARLHQVQALRRFGVSLADIGTFLANPGSNLSTIVEQQIAALNRQIDQAGILRGQLTKLHRELDAGVEPDLAAWLTTLELMTMVDTYFSKEELKQLPFFAGDAACIAEWDAMVARFKQMIAAGTPPSAAEAQTLSQEWMLKMERDTNGDPDVMVRILAMQAHEPALREQNGVTPDVEAYLKEAFAQSRLAMFKKYLSPEEFAYMDAHYRIRMDEWPGLIARVRKAIASGAAPADPQVGQLMREWIDLSQSFAGDDPATHAKIRVAYEKEPLLMIGSWITDAMKAYIGEAMAALHQQS
ncbi:MerR family transcriptional regulator [Massilia violaceinigra]|uniref:MerR family transcriptional regulator n=1 Tax=Massilia violaceinigra TaxID=2045208 RepID=A0A2D2DKP1_9BURK|nr:MerR family transcriptional regulator [Massilia violaceinigra]ATQ75568.1 MerR family transcriptional regulator [Massilia violaceinigra]